MITEYVFRIPDMDCGGCVRAITEAVQKRDAAATVDADLTAKRVRIGTATTADFAQAIKDAGFTVEKT